MPNWRTLILLGGLASLGCNVCEDLDTRMCDDLGADDCTIWKEEQLNYTAQAKTRPRKFLQSLVFGADSTTCEAAGRDDVYPKILDATKLQIAAIRKAKSHAQTP